MINLSACTTGAFLDEELRQGTCKAEEWEKHFPGEPGNGYDRIDLIP
jgi:hypothetical protein